MPRKNLVNPSEPPTLTSQQALSLLRKQLEEGNEIVRLRGDDDSRAQKWRSTTEAILNAAFGKPNGQRHSATHAFYAAGFYPVSMGNPMYNEQRYQESMIRRRTALESAIEQLEILAPPIAQVASGMYTFHSEIERVSGDLFRDGHYKQAAFEAYVRVIEEVKHRSGLNLDGDNLMNHAFGCDGAKVPALKFNSLSTDAERDEQKGYMLLFKGIVGLRNSKAHSNRLFNDPLRAQEYLSLASLLIRVLELATK